MVTVKSAKRYGLAAAFALAVLPTALVAAETITFSSGQPLNHYQGRVFVPVLTEAFARLGLTFKAAAYPSLRSLDLANSGVTDGELGRVRNLHVITKGQYPNLERVEFPVMRVLIGAYAAGGKTIDGWAGLVGHRVAHKRGRKALEKRLAEHAEGATTRRLCAWRQKAG